MKYRRDKKRGIVIISLEKGDNIHQCVVALARKLKITGGWVGAIGALKDPELGYYDLEKRRYYKRRFRGDFELAPPLPSPSRPTPPPLTVMSGDITMRDGEPFLHIHVTIAGKNFRAIAGHLFDATVAVVVEMTIFLFSKPLYRLPCEDIGLARWEPNHRPRKTKKAAGMTASMRGRRAR